MSFVEVDAFVGKIKSWIDSTPDAASFEYLVGIDVGATNIRLAIKFAQNASYQEEEGTIFESAKIKCHRMDVLLSVFNAMKDQLVSLLGKPAAGASLALAGRILDHGTRVQITNYDADSQEIRKSELPQELFPANKTAFLNDLQGCCYGIVGLGLQNKLKDYFQIMWQGQHPSADVSLEKTHYAVLAVGTGLGCGLLLNVTTPDGSDVPKFEIVPLEAGHCLIPHTGPSAPGAERERDFLSYLSKKIWKGQHSIEYEDICSGRGLLDCYEYVTKDVKGAKKLTAMDIAECSMADQPDPHCTEAMTLHYRYLMKAAQNLAIATLCKGIFFAGDNQVKNDKFVVSIQPQLHEEFLNHPRRGWLEDVKAYKQIKPLNFNLYGTFYVAGQLSKH